MSFHMWSGNPNINAWVDGWLANRLKTVYDINLERVAVSYEDGIMNVVTDTRAMHTDDVRSAQAARQDVTSGECDLVWINGANFRAMRIDDTLFGPYATQLPSAQYFDFTNPGIAYVRTILSPALLLSIAILGVPGRLSHVAHAG